MVFQRKIKDLTENLKKIVAFSKEHQQFPIATAGGSTCPYFAKTPSGKECEKMPKKAASAIGVCVVL